MPRYTSSYCAFIDRLREVDVLVGFASQKERKDPIGFRHEINALCRGAIVLLASHVEAYVKELGEIALQAFFDRAVDRNRIPIVTFYHISKDLIDEL